MHYLAALLVVLVAAVGGAMFFTDLPIAVEKLGLIEQEERRDGGEREPALPPSSDYSRGSRTGSSKRARRAIRYC